jgi:HAD superfamily hydrolase (TIGR01484 family)
VTLVLATNLDGTFLGGSPRDRHRLYALLRRLGDVLLVFATGRTLHDVEPLLRDPTIPKPRYVIADLGATVVHGATLEPLEPVDGELAARWVGEESVLRAVSSTVRLEHRRQACGRRCSFYAEDESVVPAVRTAVLPLGCDVSYSANRQLDVVARGTSKGSTLNRLMRHLFLDPDDVLVCGDSLDDLSMLTDTPCRGAVIRGAEGQLYEATRHHPGVYRTERAGAGGILEAIHELGFLQSAQTEPLPQIDFVEANLRARARAERLGRRAG